MDLFYINKFYYIRHGQTRANLERFLSGGGVDLPLNENGLKQAHEALNFIRNKNLNVQSICVSPLQRARQTAEIVNQGFGLNPIVVPQLKEWVVGSWEGLPWEEIKGKFFSDENPVGGETRAEFRARVSEGLRLALQSPNVLVVAHGVVWDVISDILGLGIRRIGNCAIYEISLSPSGNSAQCLYSGDGLCILPGKN